MVRSACLVVIALLLSVAPFAQADVAGEWEVTFSTPQGPMDFTMYVIQNGTSLRGRFTSPSGEFQLTGRVDGDNVRIVWSLPDRGKLMEITFTAKVDGDSMRGTARLATLGEGPLSAERTGR